MISSAPLPRLSDLLALIGPAPAIDAALFKTADEPLLPYARSAWAMAALMRAVAAEAAKEAVTVWFPDYFCNQSSDPVRRGGANVAFYPISEDLAPDWDACRRMADKGAPDLFILVHYYGMPGDGATARTFCNDVGACLLEDAAHVLAPVAGIGSWGDATCYSPHKLFAVPDGAFLAVRNRKLAARLDGGARGAAPASRDWFFRRAVQRLLPDGLRRGRVGRTLTDLDADPSFAALADTPAPSEIGQRLLARCLARVPVAAEARRANRRMLGELLAAAFPATPLIADSSLPLYRDPWRFETAEAARSAYRTLRSRGLPVEGWPDLAPEVLAVPDSHRVAIDLRHSVVTFPVHQSIRPDELRRLLTI